MKNNQCCIRIILIGPFKTRLASLVSCTRLAEVELDSGKNKAINDVGYFFTDGQGKFIKKYFALFENCIHTPINKVVTNRLLFFMVGFTYEAIFSYVLHYIAQLCILY